MYDMSFHGEFSCEQNLRSASAVFLMIFDVSWPGHVRKKRECWVLWHCCAHCWQLGFSTAVSARQRDDWDLLKTPKHIRLDRPTCNHLSLQSTILYITNTKTIYINVYIIYTLLYWFVYRCTCWTRGIAVPFPLSMRMVHSMNSSWAFFSVRPILKGKQTNQWIGIALLQTVSIATTCSNHLPGWTFSPWTIIAFVALVRCEVGCQDEGTTLSSTALGKAVAQYHSFTVCTLQQSQSLQTGSNMSRHLPTCPTSAACIFFYSPGLSCNPYHRNLASVRQ